jgi:hypothetical protein
MAESKIAKTVRLPIKLIMPKQGAEKKVHGGGAPPKPFRTVNAAYRKSLSHQVSAISEALLPQMKKTAAAPIRVKLIIKAAAKSHRPELLFSSQTCPIVGAGRLGVNSGSSTTLRCTVSLKSLVSAIFTPPFSFLFCNPANTL